MKNILLTLMVFGLVGCATNKMIVFSQPIDAPLEVSSKPQDEKQRFIIADSYNQLTANYQYGTKRKIGHSLKAEAMNISSGEKWHVGNFQGMYLREWVVTQCEAKTGSQCIVSKYLDEVYYLDLEDYKIRRSQAELKFQEYVKQKKARGEEQEKYRKEKILADLNQRCLDIGFTGESNILACIQREAQHERELAMQRLELQRTYSQNQTQTINEDEDIPFLIKFLGDVVLGVAEQYPAAKLEANKRQEAYNQGVRQGQAAQRARCNNQQGNC